MSNDKGIDENLSQYRMSYRDVAMHKVMLQDVVRTEAYEKSINDVVQAGQSVLDFGCGTGILAIRSSVVWKTRITCMRMQEST